MSRAKVVCSPRFHPQCETRVRWEAVGGPQELSAGLSIAISAGEASGDLNGAELVSRIRGIRPDVELWGGGGQRMRNAGVELVSDMSGFGTIGISETIKALPRISARYFRLRRELLRRRPDIFVPIDFGAFNIRLGQIAHRNGIRVVYYFPPSSWRRRSATGRACGCGGSGDHPFPWSVTYCRHKERRPGVVDFRCWILVKPSMDRTTF